MEDSTKRMNLVEDTIIHFINVVPPGSQYGETYDSIKFVEGYEKPPKEEFEAKLQELIDAQPWKEIREERDTALIKTDKYTVPDWPHSTPEVRQAWLDYRQALRDLPSVTEDPANPVWPVAPQ
tara:strand:- start:1894 stop:2262 length:369 start_codon:yes stop_codon:yes gene_type:complete